MPTSSDNLFDPSSAAGRVGFVAGKVIAQLPPSRRAFPGAKFDNAAKNRLKTTVAAWYGASALSRDAFRDRLLPWYISDSAVDHLRAASKGMVEARDEKALGEAGANLAFAMQKIGMEWWPVYLVQASQRAMVAVSEGLIAGVTKIGMTKSADLPGKTKLAALSLNHGIASADSSSSAAIQSSSGGSRSAPTANGASSKPILDLNVTTSKLKPDSAVHLVASADDRGGLKTARAAALEGGLTTPEQFEIFHNAITDKGITSYRELVRIARQIKEGTY